MNEHKVVIACTDSNGRPGFDFLKVECTEAEFIGGLHYDVAKEWAIMNSYEEPMIYYDEDDIRVGNCQWLLDHFDWNEAEVVKV